MADLIEREALLAHFTDLKNKADTLRDKLYLDGVMAVIDVQPTVDAAPVVRCKDCILRGGYDCPMQYAIEWGIGNTPPDDDDYCSTGQKCMDADAPERGKDGLDG